MSDRQNASMVLMAISLEPAAQRLPRVGRDLPMLARPGELGDDARAHLGGRLAGEGDGQHAPRVDAGGEQVEVAIDEHLGLAGAGRGLERHVHGGVHGVGPGVGVARSRAS